MQIASLYIRSLKLAYRSSRPSGDTYIGAIREGTKDINNQARFYHTTNALIPSHRSQSKWLLLVSLTY